MKNLFTRISMVLLIASLAGVVVFAKAKKERVTFPTNIKVNGTVVKKGVYDLKFDDQTGELSILRGNKVIARASASVAKRDGKAHQYMLRSTGKGDDEQLVAVTFGGADYDVVLGGSQATR